MNFIADVAADFLKVLSPSQNLRTQIRVHHRPRIPGVSESEHKKIRTNPAQRASTNRCLYVGN